MNLQELLGDAYREDMTVEEINEAISKKNLIEDNSSTISKLRDSLNKATSEASNYKKQLNERLSQEEKDAQARQEENDALMKELETLRKEKVITGYKAKYISLGYDEKLANETAEAMYEGNTDKVFENQSLFTKQQIAKAEKELVKNTPHPQGGNKPNSGAMTREEFSKLGAKEKGKFIMEHREEYNSMYSKENEE